MKEIEGDTLGQKHRNYNAALRELISTHAVPTILSDDNDISNLLRIDVASHYKDIEYILNVLKGDDMLYVSRALSRCLWLVTDEEYAHIINPEYLQNDLFPNMTTKAIHKVKKFIRHNIKDETRAEKFYSYEKKKTDAIKWLPYCSVEFIEKNIENHIATSYDNSLTLRLFKRLSEKSITIFEIILNKLKYYDRYKYLQVVTFFLKSDTDKYLDVLENNNTDYGYPKLNRKATEIIMKNSSKRVIDKIEKYVSSIDIPTFVQFLSADEIKAFLYTQAEKDLQSAPFSSLRRLFQCNTLRFFIKRLPENEQFDFARTIGLLELPTDAVAFRINKLCTETNPEPYVWYQFAPFDQAFEKIIKMIPLSADNHQKRGMLYLLIKCADNNLQYIQDVLKYFLSKHRTEEINYKFKFVKEVLARTQITKFDDKTWNVLNELLRSMNVYDTSSDQEIHCEIIYSIIIYNVLKGIDIPEAIEKRFSFNTLKSYRVKMDLEQQNKIFNYLYNNSFSKIKDPITNEKEFLESIDTLKHVLKLIQDWSKPFLDYPAVLNKIKELIALKKEKSWKPSLSPLYNVNKSWKKHMFEVSLNLHPSEEVCVNALKYDPQLLTRHNEEVDKLRTDDKVSLQRHLSKLRIYWPKSIGHTWTETFLINVKEAKGEKAAVKSLCTLLPKKELLHMIETYKPINSKIDWKQTDERVLNVQRSLAKNMHLGRPQPSPDAILLYATGDYLQFALPSLLAIFYNLKSPINKQYIPKLLDAPVSVQKHGIRLAFRTLDREELKQIFFNCWQTSKNTSIRTIIFNYTFKLLCGENDPANATSLWELLELFIDNLTFKEDKVTYEILSKVEEVPATVKAKFLVKSYNFLQKLIPTVDDITASNYKWFCVQLAEHMREVMDTICPEFTFNLIQDFIENDFFGTTNKFMRPVHHCNGMIQAMSAYLLHASNESNQLQKYEKLMVPLMKHSFEKWGEKHEGNYFIKRNFQHLLSRLSFDLKDYVAEKKVLTPVKIFSLIQIELEKSLTIPENYLILTQWRITVALAKLIERYYSAGMELDEKCGFEFGKNCLEILKNDVALHFPCIYVLFSRSVKIVIDHVLPENAIMHFYEAFISDIDFIQGYLSTMKIGADYRRNEKFEHIWKKVFAHPSVEIKMHYYSQIDEKNIY